MSTTLASYRDLVRDRMGSVGSDPQVTAERLNRSINQSRQQLALERDWWWNLDVDTFALNSLSPATEDASIRQRPLPTGFLRTQMVADVTNRRRLEPVSHEALYLYDDYATVYTVAGTSLWFRDSGDARTLVHRYYKVPGPLFDDQQTDTVPDAFQEGIIEYATHLMLRFLREDRKAKEALEAYDAWHKRAADNRWATRRPPRLRVRPGSML